MREAPEHPASEEPNGNVIGTGNLTLNLSAKFAVLLAIILVAALLFQAGWSYYARMQQAQTQMLVRGQDIAAEVESIIQSTADLDTEKRAEVIRAFIVDASLATECPTSLIYTAANSEAQPSIEKPFAELALAPDDFDIEALSFLESSGNDAYYQLTTTENGLSVFRYVRALGNGSPYAISITIPADSYTSRIVTDALGDVAFSGLIVLAAFGIVLVVVRRLLTQPIRKMDEAAAAIETGDFDVKVPSKQRYRDELDELADHITQMAGELKALYTDLEGQVDARTRELSQANGQLERQSEELRQANQALKEDNEYRVKFLSVMSHELRTPLTSILAFLDIWEREHGPRDSDEAKIIKEIRINGKLLLDRVNNILEISRIDAGRSRMEWEAIDPFDLVAQLKATMHPLAENVGVDLSVEADEELPIIWGDGEKLLRILENLTENAVKYTQAGGYIRVRIDYDTPKDEAVFTVADNGRGIDEESLAHIFDGFVQARNASARISEGSGLGLSVVRELAEMHGGSVSVESSADEAAGTGTTFTVRIPCGGPEDEEMG